MTSRIFTCFFSLLFPAFAGEVLLSSSSSSWWYYTGYDGEAQQRVDPGIADPDFHSTWNDQKVGTYVGGAGYDGPAFEQATASFVRYWPLASPAPGMGWLTLPVGGEEGPVWLVHEVDGGESGMKDLELTLSTFDGAALFVNGEYVTSWNLPFGPPSVSVQPLWGGNSSTAVEVSVPLELRLKPGPNLVAVMAVPLKSDPRGPEFYFSMGLEGTPIRGEGAYFDDVVVGENSLVFRWETETPQSSKIRFGPSADLLDGMAEQNEMVQSQEIALTGLLSGEEYFYEVLDGSGSPLVPPVEGSVMTRKEVLIPAGDDGWFFFQSIDGNGVALDPAGGDPDFDTTWYQQNLGGWRPDSDPYDGPVFQIGGSAPFHFGAVVDPGGTALQMPAGGGRGEYYARVIDGGELGYRDLELRMLALDGARVYLNGRLIVARALSQAEEVSFFGIASHFSYPGLQKVGIEEGECDDGVPYLLPGPNLLAVVVKPAFGGRDRSGFDLEMRGNREMPAVFGLSVSGEEVGLPTLRWSSLIAGTSVIRYGTDPDNLVEVSVDGVSKQHEATLAGIERERRYYVEVETFDGGISLGVLCAEFNSHSSFVRGPFLQKASHDGITIHWQTEVSGTEKVYWGISPESLGSVVSSPGGVIHEARLSGLQPSTTYYYGVTPNYDPVRRPDEIHSFKTYPGPGESAPTRIWVIGDSGTGNFNAQSVYGAYRSFAGEQHTDVWLMLGDNAYNFGSDASYQTAVFQMYPELLARTAVWPTRGNHDNYAGNNYYQVFDLPTAGESGGIPSGTEAYYSFDHGDIHFVCLNSINNYRDRLGSGGMADWLQMDLEATTAKWIIAFFHHGPYTFGSHNSDREIEHINMRGHFLGILEQYGVDLILSGHSHQYERSMLLEGHYGDSSTFSRAEHAVDSGNGSTLGSLGDSGQFVFDGGDGAYQKSVLTGERGQVSVIAGASGKLSGWQYGSKDLVQPNRPHPVMVTSLRLLGSLVLDIDGDQLMGRYLSSSRQIRDQFCIDKRGNVEVSSDTADDGTATRFKISVNHPATRDLYIRYTLEGAALGIENFPASTSGMIKIPKGKTSATVELIVPIGDQSAEERVLTLTLESVALDDPTNIVPDVPVSEATSLTLKNSPSQLWWLQHFGPTLAPDWNRNEDGDALPALMEYAYGYDPKVFDPGVEPVNYAIRPTTIEMLYVVNKDRPDLQFRAVKSDDLQHWRPGDVETELLSFPTAVGFEVHRAILPISPGHQEFLQLEVVRP